MEKHDFLFVYGTLRKDERADLTKHHGLFCVSPLGLDAVNGKLYHIGAFPGFKPLSSSNEDFNPKLPFVVGEVFLVLDVSIGAILDAYEGYNADNPSKGHYDRQQFLTREGRLVWVYVYNPMVSDDQLIETGDWKNPRLLSTMRVPNIPSRKRK